MTKKTRKSPPRVRNLFLELLVVFLGVTSGFILNNWRTEKDSERLESQYLKGFLQDAKSNEFALKEAVKTDSLWLTRMHPILLSLKDSSISADSANVAMEMSISLFQLEKHTGTYTDIINSGNLSLIDDFELRESIVDYHIAMDQIEFTDSYFREFFNQFVFPYFMQNFDLLERVPKNNEIYRSLAFKNVITSYYGMVRQRANTYAGMRYGTTELKKLLLEELDEK